MFTNLGEMNASRALEEASEIISEPPQALQLRYLQMLQSIAAERNSTIIFPLPMDMINRALNKWNVPMCVVLNFSPSVAILW